MALKPDGRRERGTVLIGFADALAAPEAAWSLLDGGWRVVAFSRSGSRPALRRDRRIELCEVTAPEDDAAGCTGQIARLVQSTGADVVLPLDDAALVICGPLAERGWWLGGNPRGAGSLPHRVIFAGPVGAQLDFVLDKRYQVAAAAQAGLSVPTDMMTDPNSGTFPAIVKPALAGELQGDRLVRGRSTVCADEEAVQRAISATDGPVLVQPCLRGVGEGLFCVVTPEGPRAWSAHRRVRMMNPSGSGASACASIPVDPELAAAAGRMLVDVGWRGIAMVELLRDPAGTPWFMEVNGRTWGSTALARRIGLEYPSWAVAEAVGESWAEPGSGLAARSVTARHAGREIVHLLAVLRGPRAATPQPWPARGETVRSVLHFRRSDRWYNWQPGRTFLWFDDTVRTVMQQIAGRRR